MKIKAFQEKDYRVSSEILEWGSKHLHKSQRGAEISIKCMRMSSTPSPQVIDDPSLNAPFSLLVNLRSKSLISILYFLDKIPGL